MIALLLVNAALAGGGGLYVQSVGGAATTDSTGFIARGVATGAGIGAYWGDYRGTFRYGRYWRLGLTGRNLLVEPLGQRVSSTTVWGAQLTRGADLMNLGVWGSVTGGLSTFQRAENLGLVIDPDKPVTYGAFVSAAVGLAYNFTHNVALTARVEPGVLISDGFDLSYQGGWGLGLTVRVPIVRTNWHTEDE